MAGIIGDLITQLNQEYEMNKAHHWQKKITLLNLLLTASIGCYTYQHGATEILVPQESFQNYLEALIIPELIDSANIDALPLLRATCIKFVYMFRNQVPDDFVTKFVDLFADYLKSSMIVTQSYAAASIEKLFLKRSLHNKNVPVLTDKNIDQGLVSKLLQNLCELLQ